jgi:hypothetical protein
MRIQIAAVGVAGVLAFGLVQVPAASASTHPPRVGETVLKNGTWHKYEAKYWNLPGRIALLAGASPTASSCKPPTAVAARPLSSRSAGRATGTSPA